MKRITSFMTAVTMTAVLIIVILFISCKKESRALNSSNTQALNSRNSSALSDEEAAPLKLDLMHTTLTIEDANGSTPTGDATLLFDNVGHTLVTAPDGHQVTLGEFNRVSGYAEVKCINAGTHVVIHLKGLIPNGVYTIWTVTFKSPGFTETLENAIGVGAMGPGDGSKNAFTASAAGTASLSAIVPAGPLSELPAIVGNCLSSEYEVQLWGVYHMDGLTHGGSPGDESTWVEQFVFDFFGSQL
jgi:hypothetical protein